MDPTLEQILRNTVASRQIEEVAFMHVFTSNIMPGIRAANPGLFEHDLGATFSVTMNEMLLVMSIDQSSRVEATFAAGPYTTMIVSSSTSGDRREDAVVSGYAPERAAATAGKLVFHFFSATDADLFLGLIQ